MKPMIIAALLLAATATAHAGDVLEVGASAGADRAMSHKAMYLGGDLPISKLWRIHLQVSYGRANTNTAEMSLGSNHYLAERAGFAVRPCVSASVCLIAGVDAALMTESYVIGHEDDDVFGRWTLIEERGGFAAIPRLGVEVGTGHWRFRPSIEATLSKTIDEGRKGNSDLVGVAGNAAVTYTW